MNNVTYLGVLHKAVMLELTPAQSALLARAGSWHPGQEGPGRVAVSIHNAKPGRALVRAGLMVERSRYFVLSAWKSAPGYHEIWTGLSDAQRRALADDGPIPPRVLPGLIKAGCATSDGNWTMLGLALQRCRFWDWK